MASGRKQVTYDLHNAPTSDPTALSSLPAIYDPIRSRYGALTPYLEGA